MKAIAVPTLEQAIELVHTGKIHDFNFEINGWNAKLNGFEYVVNGTTYNVPERQKAAPYVKAVENLINRKYRKYGK